MINLLIGFLLGLTVSLSLVVVLGLRAAIAKENTEKHRVELEKLLRKKP